MKVLSARQNNIIEMAQKNGSVSVEELAEYFVVSAQTIRKDLNKLCSRHLLRRIHGGAVVGSGIENVSYEARRVLAPEAKRKIGIIASQLIPDNSSLFINIGTTTEQVAKALADHNGLLIITNNINTVTIMQHYPGIKLIIAGGEVRTSDGGVVGIAAVDFIRQFKVDYAIIGVSGLDQDGGLLDYDYREVRVAQAIIANARKVILVADMMKFRRNAPARIGHISEIDILVTDGPVTPKFAAICDQAGVRIECACSSGV